MSLCTVKKCFFIIGIGRMLVAVTAPHRNGRDWLDHSKNTIAAQ